MIYSDILVLKDMLETDGIPFEIEGSFYGYRICYPRMDNPVCSVIEHDYSIGAEHNLLEIRGLLSTAEESEVDGVIGNLTAINVYERIKNHWIKNKDTVKEVYNL